MSVRLSLLTLLAALVLSAGPAPVRAEAHPPTDAAHAKADAGHGHGEKKGGLSFLQLERYDLGIFTLVVFGLLVLVLSRTAWPAITEGLAKREASIKGARDEALAAKAEAEALREKLKSDHAAAQGEIRALIEEARRDADALRASEKEAGTKDAAAERERAKREIEAAKDVALNDIYKQAVDLAALMSSKTLGRSITADDHRQLLDASLAELKQAASKA